MRHSTSLSLISSCKFEWIPLNEILSEFINWHWSVTTEQDSVTRVRCMKMAGHIFCLCVWTSYCDTRMMMPSNGNIFRVTGYLCGEFTGHRWLTRTKACGAELWWFLWSAPAKKRLSKQSWGWWFATPSRSLMRHGNAHCLDLIVFCTIQQIVGIIINGSLGEGQRKLYPVCISWNIIGMEMVTLQIQTA